MEIVGKRYTGGYPEKYIGRGYTVEPCGYFAASRDAFYRGITSLQRKGGRLCTE